MRTSERKDRAEGTSLYKDHWVPLKLEFTCASESELYAKVSCAPGPVAQDLSVNPYFGITSMYVNVMVITDSLSLLLERSPRMIRHLGLFASSRDHFSITDMAT